MQRIGDLRGLGHPQKHRHLSFEKARKRGKAGENRGGKEQEPEVSAGIRLRDFPPKGPRVPCRRGDDLRRVGRREAEELASRARAAEQAL